MVGSTGFAIAVIGLCLLATGPLRWVLFPVAAVGSMALTVYTLQVVAIAVLDPVIGDAGEQLAVVLVHAWWRSRPARSGR